MDVTLSWGTEWKFCATLGECKILEQFVSRAFCQVNSESFLDKEGRVVLEKSFGSDKAIRIRFLQSAGGGLKLASMFCHLSLPEIARAIHSFEEKPVPSKSVADAEALPKEQKSCMLESTSS